MMLLLVRHGQSTWNLERRIQGWQDPPLSSAGRDQAKRMAARLEGLRLEAVFSSTLQRAEQTAQPLARATGARLILDERLREQQLGVLEGLTTAEVRARYPDRWQRMQQSSLWVDFPQAEPLDALAARVEGFVRQHLTPDGRGGRAVVTHGGTLGVLLGHLLEVGERGRRSRPFAFANASLTLLRHDRDRWRLELLNCTRHLDNDPLRELVGSPSEHTDGEGGR